jgi:peptidoglycan/LPS O-acetylase OafA/YrhL
MYFYVVFAFALLLGRARFPWVMGGWVAVTLTLYATVGRTTNPYLAIVASPLSLEFVLGAVIGLATVHGRLVRPYAALALGIVSFSACLVFLALSGWDQFPSAGVRVLLVAVPAGLVVYGAIGVETRYGRIVTPFQRHLGDASYSLYLTHVPALTLLVTVWAGRLPTGPVVHALMLPAALVYVVFGALVCYALLERPLQNATARLLRRQPRPDVQPLRRRPSVVRQRFLDRWWADQATAVTRAARWPRMSARHRARHCERRGDAHQEPPVLGLLRSGVRPGGAHRATRPR